MEEALENGKESSYSANADGMDEGKEFLAKFRSTHPFYQ